MNPEERRLYTNKYRANRRKEAISLLGNQCVECGSDTNLEFDHINPATKKANISSLLTSSKENFFSELSKCQLLCGNCHKRKTASEPKPIPWNKGRLTHGSSGYTQGCRCKVCKLGERTRKGRY